MSENMQDNIGRVADKIIHPIAVLKHGEFAIKEDKPAEYDEARRDYDKSGNRSEGFASSIVPTLEERTIYERRPSAAHANGQPLFSLIEEKESKGEGSGPAEAEVPSEVKKMNTVADGSEAEGKSGVPKVQGSPGDKELYGEPANAVDNDDAPPNQGTERSDEEEQYRLAVEARKVLRKHMNAKVGMSPWTMPTPTPKINPNRFHDPLDETFWKDMWVAVAVHNTEIFRKVFRCIPDDLVTTWASYKAFANHAEKFNKVPEDIAGKDQDEPPKVVHDGPGTQGAGGGGSGGGVVGQGQNDSAKPSESGHESVKEGSEGSHEKGSSATGRGVPLEPMRSEAPTSPRRASEHGRESSNGSQKQTASGPNDAWHQWEKEEMEALLGEVRGQLGEYASYGRRYCS
jgi:phospholipase D1/2